MALALTSRRITLAAVTSVAVAVALAVAVGGRSCSVDDDGPDSTVREMLTAAKAGDRKVVLELLSPSTRTALDERAQRATDLVGSSQRYTALELISIGPSDDVPPPSDITVIEERGDRAVVEIVSQAGRSRVDLIRIEGKWLIDIPSYAGR